MTATDKAGFFIQLMCHENQAFWTSIRAGHPQDNGTVLVDCSQPPQTVNTYLFFGAQLAHTLGAKMVAYTMDLGTSISKTDAARQRALVASYGAEHIVLGKDPIDEVTKTQSDKILSSLKNLDDLKSLKLGHVRLGELIISELSKKLRKPDIQFEDVDEATIQRFLAIYGEVESLFAQYDVTAYFSAHFTYREGIATQFALHSGAAFYQYIRTAQNTVLKLVDPEKKIERPGDIYASWRHEAVRPYLDIEDHDLTAWADLVFESRYLPMGKKPGWWPARDPNIEYSEIDPKMITSKRRVVLICLHAYSDAIFGFSGEYDTYFDWIQDTLDIISKDEAQDITYIFKEHPQQLRYVKRSFVEELKSKIKALPNAIYVTEAIPYEVFSELCDTAITVRGSAALETVGSGLCCATLGTGMTSGIDINIEIQDRNQYIDVLVGVQPAPPTADQIRRARVFFSLFNFVFVHDTQYLAPYAPNPDMFMNTYRLMKKYDMDNDPSWEAMRRLVEGDAPVIPLTREEVLAKVKEDYARLLAQKQIFESVNLNEMHRKLRANEKKLVSLQRDMKPFVTVRQKTRSAALRLRGIGRFSLPLSIYSRLPQRLKAYATITDKAKDEA